MIKIVFLTPNTHLELSGGAEIQVRYLMEHFVKQANIYQISQYSSPKYRCSRIDGVIHAFIPKRKTYKFIQNLLFMDFCYILPLLIKIRPDKIYLRGVSFYLLIAFFYKTIFNNQVKIVLHIASDLDVQKSKITSLRNIEANYCKNYIKHANIILCQNAFQRDILVNLHKIKVNDIVKNIIKVNENFSNKNDTEIVVIWVGNLKDVKRPQLFFELAKRNVNNKKIIFKMIGRVPHKYTEMAKGISNIIFFGELKHEEVLSQFQTAHILVNTSLNEGFPNTFLEAWANSVCVLSLKIDPNDYIKNHGLGIVCEDNIEKLSIIMDYLISDKDKLNNIRDKARKFIEKNYLNDQYNIMEQYLIKT